jgi:hypothetical protein
MSKETLGRGNWQDLRSRLGLLVNRVGNRKLRSFHTPISLLTGGGPGVHSMHDSHSDSVLKYIIISLTYWENTYEFTEYHL